MNDERQDDMRAWITVRQAAAELEIGVHGVRWLINNDRIEAVKFGTVWMVRRASVEAYKAARDKPKE